MIWPNGDAYARYEATVFSMLITNRTQRIASRSLTQSIYGCLQAKSGIVPDHKVEPAGHLLRSHAEIAERAGVRENTHITRDTVIPHHFWSCVLCQCAAAPSCLIPCITHAPYI